MISKLSGTLIHKEERFAVVDVQGVGYKVFATHETLEKSPLSKPITFWTYLVVREDALDLYGFITKDELNFFELLISISGIGPRTALPILGLSSLSNLKRAISSGDAGYLTKVAGIGKKNAEKIILELRDKMTVGDEDQYEVGSHSDSLEALKALGYAERAAREALKQVPEKITDAGECVKFALKILSKNN